MQYNINLKLCKITGLTVKIRHFKDILILVNTEKKIKQDIIKRMGNDIRSKRWDISETKWEIYHKQSGRYHKLEHNQSETLLAQRSWKESERQKSKSKVSVTRWHLSGRRLNLPEIITRKRKSDQIINPEENLHFRTSKQQKQEYCWYWTSEWWSG